MRTCSTYRQCVLCSPRQKGRLKRLALTIAESLSAELSWIESVTFIGSQVSACTVRTLSNLYSRVINTIWKLRIIFEVHTALINMCCRAALTHLGIPISGLATRPTAAKRI
jgi:hypothetical protein